MGEKKRVWEKHFLCALTSSLDELELELPSWPHLRATTWAEVSNIRTLLTQENDGWRGEKGERKVLLIFCSQKKQASLSICYSLFGFLRITRHCHVTAYIGKNRFARHTLFLSVRAKANSGQHQCVNMCPAHNLDIRISLSFMWFVAFPHTCYTSVAPNSNKPSWSEIQCVHALVDSGVSPQRSPVWRRTSGGRLQRPSDTLSL